MGFTLDELATADKVLATGMLKSCGTGIDHFYQSVNIEQLQAAFKSIGSKVAGSTVRLTK